MKILITAATELELNGLKKKLPEHILPHCVFLVTGVGMVHTCFSLTEHLLQHSYQLVVQMGIAGAFDRSLALTEVVWVKSDEFSELGAEDGDSFISATQLGLINPLEEPYQWAELKPQLQKEFSSLQKLRQVRAITVNTVHGNEASIVKTKLRINPQIESMEGAAFFYTCMKLKVPCIQIRSISNYVEKRNRESWNIPGALLSLDKAVIELLTEIMI